MNLISGQSEAHRLVGLFLHASRSLGRLVSAKRAHIAKRALGGLMRALEPVPETAARLGRR